MFCSDPCDLPSDQTHLWSTCVSLKSLFLLHHSVPFPSTGQQGASEWFLRHRFSSVGWHGGRCENLWSSNSTSTSLHFSNARQTTIAKVRVIMRKTYIWDGSSRQDLGLRRLFWGKVTLVSWDDINDLVVDIILDLHWGLSPRTDSLFHWFVAKVGYRATLIRAERLQIAVELWVGCLGNERGVVDLRGCPVQLTWG